MANSKCSTTVTKIKNRYLFVNLLKLIAQIRVEERAMIVAVVVRRVRLSVVSRCRNRSLMSIHAIAREETLHFLLDLYT